MLPIAGRGGAETTVDQTLMRGLDTAGPWFVSGLALSHMARVAVSGSQDTRDRLLEADVARQFLSAPMALPKVKRLLSSEHFSVAGTLIDALASMKSFQPKDGSGDPPGPGRNGERDFHGEKRSNETHASVTDPDARLYRKADGRESRLCYMGHALMENRNGLVVDACLTLATGTAEREATLAMLDRRQAKGTRITLAADKAYDVTAFVGDLRRRRVTPHIAINGSVSKTGKVRKTAIDKRTTRHPGYQISLRCRKRIEEVFGWIKAQAGLAKVKVRGKPKAACVFGFAITAYNRVRLPKLMADAPKA